LAVQKIAETFIGQSIEGSNERIRVTGREVAFNIS
jgi:hypothetical protein